MEDQNKLDQYLGKDKNNMSLNQSSLDYLEESAKWSKIIAVIGYVSIGFIILMAIFFGVGLSALPTDDLNLPFSGFFYAMLYMIMALIYYFPVMYLFKYAANTKAAIEERNEEKLIQAFKNLKSHHKFIGVIMVATIVLYLLKFILIALAGAAALF